MIPALFIALLTCLIGAGLITAHIRAHRLSTCTWNELLSRLEPVDMDGIKLVASDSVVLPDGASPRRAEDLWDMLGGIEGLRRLDNNAKVMIALAGYMERQNHQERMILAERMRSDGLTVRQAIRSIRLTRYIHTNTEALQAHVQAAAKSYAAMRRRLPALYEMSCGGSYRMVIDAH